MIRGGPPVYPSSLNCRGPRGGAFRTGSGKCQVETRAAGTEEGEEARHMSAARTLGATFGEMGKRVIPERKERVRLGACGQKSEKEECVRTTGQD